MKTLGKIFIFIVVIILAIGIAYVSYYGEDKNATNTSANTTNESNQKNETNTNTSTVTDVENKDYVGEEEKVEPEQEPEEDNQENEQTNQEEEQPVELTGKDKAIDIVKKQYALEGQTVRFDHMEGSDYIIKLNDGTAVTWYFVDGTTWEAEEY